jgi:hypothetical protein
MFLIASPRPPPEPDTIVLLNISISAGILLRGNGVLHAMAKLGSSRLHLYKFSSSCYISSPSPLPGALIYNSYTRYAHLPVSLSLLYYFLSAGSLRCTQPWSSSGLSSSSISQLLPAMPKRVELIPSEMYLSRVFRLSSIRVISIVHTIWIISHFAFTPGQSRAVWAMVHLTISCCRVGYHPSARSRGVALFMMVSPVIAMHA